MSTTGSRVSVRAPLANAEAQGAQDAARDRPGPGTRFGTVTVDGVRVAFREAGDPSNPKLVLLHGFPSSSHQFRDLIPALADRFHVLAPDYPGFGNSDTPDPNRFAYTFDRLSEVIESFLRLKGFHRYGLFVHDYGGPVGFRILTRNPDALEWLIVQNSNAYDVGLTSAWDGFRNGLWAGRSPATEKPLAGLLTRDAIRGFYLHGVRRPELISPDTWEMDWAHMREDGRTRVNMDLFYDYRTNPRLYPAWHAFLRSRRPRTIIFWGQHDAFFGPEGGEAYLQDLPEAELHRLDTGHFAIEDHLGVIASKMRRFYDERVRSRA